VKAHNELLGAEFQFAAQCFGAAEDTVIRPALVDAGVEAGRTYGELHQTS
jgi:hypothetical protein